MRQTYHESVVEAGENVGNAENVLTIADLRTELDVLNNSDLLSSFWGLQKKPFRIVTPAHSLSKEGPVRLTRPVQPFMVSSLSVTELPAHHVCYGWMDGWMDARDGLLLSDWARMERGGQSEWKGWCFGLSGACEASRASRALLRLSAQALFSEMGA